MPIMTKIDPKINLRTHFATGYIRIEEIIGELKRISVDPTIEAFDSLWDFREAEVDFTEEQIRKVEFVLSHRRPLPENAKAAIVVLDDLAFGLGRMFEITVGNNIRTVMIFREIDEALKWLGKSIPE